MYWNAIVGCLQETAEIEGDADDEENLGVGALDDEEDEDDVGQSEVETETGAVKHGHI